MRTAGTFSQDSPQTDGVIFIGASEFMSPTLSNTGLTKVAVGKVPYVAPVSTTTEFFKALDQILRTGVLNSQAYGYTAFGTTGPPPVPGPSSVANTSDASGVSGHPPLTIANLPTIKGPVVGAIPKGIQINYIDVIYQVLGAASTAILFGLTKTVFGAAGAGATAPVVTNLIALAANGLPTAVAANPVTTRINIANPSMLATDETEILAELSFQNPAGCTVNFYGLKLGVSFNYN